MPPLMYWAAGSELSRAAVPPIEAARSPSPSLDERSRKEEEAAQFESVLTEKLRVERHERAAHSAYRFKSEADGERRRDESPSSEPVQRKIALKAADIMSKRIVSIQPDVTLDQARSRMNEKRVRHLPVIDQERMLVGILSDRDLLRASEARSVREAMTTRVLTATLDTPIREIAEAFLNNRFHALPVVNNQGDVVGIVTSSDILKAIVQHAPIDLWA